MKFLKRDLSTPKFRIRNPDRAKNRIAQRTLHKIGRGENTVLEQSQDSDNEFDGKQGLMISRSCREIRHYTIAHTSTDRSHTIVIQTWISLLAQQVTRAVYRRIVYHL